MDCNALRIPIYFRVEGLHTFHLVVVVSSSRSAGAARQCWGDFFSLLDDIPGAVLWMLLAFTPALGVPCPKPYGWGLGISEEHLSGLFNLIPFSLAKQ